MELDERLKQWTAGCLWVSDPGLVVQLVPALAAETPPLLELPGPRGEAVSGLVLTCVVDLTGPILSVIRAEASQVLAGAAALRLEEIPAAEIGKDPLVLELTREIEQTRWPGLRSQGLPSLAAAWICAQAAAGRAASLPGVDPTLARSCDELVGKINALETAARGRALARLAWAVAGRVAAAVNLASRADARVDSGGLFRALMPNPLVMVAPRGEAPPALPLVAAVLGLSVDPQLLAALVPTAAAALAAHAARVGRNKAEPADLALAALLPRSEGPPDAMAVLLHPVASVALLAGLPDLIDAKGLIAAGVSKDIARSMGDRVTLRALASLWGDLRLALLRWDVLSALLARAYPVRFDAGRWHGPYGVIPDGKWSMMVPRTANVQAVHAVVAVKLTPLREALGEAARRRGLPSATGPLSRLWSEAIHRSAAVAETLVAEHGVAVFANVNAGLAFARAFRARVAATTELPMGPGQEATPVTGGVALPVGLAVGGVLGGSDGRTTWLGGAPVTEALSLAGLGPADGVGEAALSGQVTRARRGALRSDGVVATAAAVEALLLGVDKAGGNLHRRGENTRAGGIADDFRDVVIPAWWELDANEVAVQRPLDAEDPAGPAELLLLSREAFSELHRQDARAAATRLSAPPPARPPAASLAAEPWASPRPEPPRVEPVRPEPARPVPARPAAPAFAPPRPPAPPPPPVETPRIGPPMIPVDLDEDEEDNPTAPDMTPVLPLGQPVTPPPPRKATLPADPFAARPGSADSRFGELPRTPSLTGGPDPFGAHPPAPRPADPFGSSKPSADPFGSSKPSADPFGSSKPSADPFGSSKPSADPFGSSKPSADPFGSSKPSADPFAAARPAPAFTSPDPFSGSTDPFAAPRVAPAEEPEEPVTGPLVGALAMLDVDEPAGLGDGSRGGREEADDTETDTLGPSPEAILMGSVGDGPMVTIDDEWSDDEDSDWDQEPHNPIQWTRPNRAAAPAPTESRDAELSFLHAEYAPDDMGDAEPFSEGPSPTPAVGDSDGGFEPLGGEVASEVDGFDVWGSRPAAPPPPAPPPAPPPPPPPAPAPAGPDPAIAGLIRQFRGYVVKREGGAFIFGLKDGVNLRDAHRFRAADPVNAYVEFLQAKIREGFVPQASDSVPLGDPAMVSDISASLIEAAYGRVKEG